MITKSFRCYFRMLGVLKLSLVFVIWKLERNTPAKILALKCFHSSHCTKVHKLVYTEIIGWLIAGKFRFVIGNGNLLLILLTASLVERMYVLRCAFFTKNFNHLFAMYVNIKNIIFTIFFCYIRK